MIKQTLSKRSNYLYQVGTDKNYTLVQCFRLVYAVDLTKRQLSVALCKRVVYILVFRTCVNVTQSLNIYNGIVTPQSNLFTVTIFFLLLCSHCFLLRIFSQFYIFKTYFLLIFFTRRQRKKNRSQKNFHYIFL